MPITNDEITPGAISLGKRKRGRTTDGPRPSPSPSQNTPPSLETGSTNASDTPTPNASAPKKPDENKTKTKRAKSKAPKPTSKQSSTPSSSPSPSWPLYLIHIEKVHRALNLVSTFVSARRQVAPTLETLRPAVEAHLRCGLVVEDVAGVVALRRGGGVGDGGGGGGGADGDGGSGSWSGSGNGGNANGRNSGIRFEYVSETDLALSMGAVEAEREREYLVQDSEAAGPGRDEQVLVFEFLDAELTESKGAKGRGGEDRMRMPVFSQAQMMRLIERRNAKFVQAVNEFVDRCVVGGLDPEMVLKDAREAYVPKMAEFEVEEPGKLTSTLPASIPRERKSIPEIVQEIKDSPWYTGQIVPDGHRVFEAQDAVYGDLDFLLSQDLVNTLYNTKGITRFFAHQAEAINALHEGYNVVVATSTSSGKSLIYQLPVLHALEQDHNTRAMYIFPTKALAQDQRRSLREMVGFMPGMGDVLVETFDGDTPMSERNVIRDDARIIFTNPDMLHITILPQEDRWRTFLKNLKYVVGRSCMPGKFGPRD